MSSTLKNTIIFVLVFVAIGGGYYFFAGKKTDTTGLTAINPVTGLEDATAGQSGVGGEFLTTLLNIRSIQLDGTLFTNPAFRSLQDFTTDLVDTVDAGRPNPFAPIGADSLASSQSATASATTTTTQP